MRVRTMTEPAIKRPLEKGLELGCSRLGLSPDHRGHGVGKNTKAAAMITEVIVGQSRFESARMSKRSTRSR
jgi:hypothetical protein